MSGVASRDAGAISQGVSGTTPRSAALEKPLPVVAIVGRANAGKSTLFNRLVRARRALVDAAPGVTRDRNFAEASFRGRRFLVVDTGGFEADAREGLAAEVRAQSELAIEEADAIILVADGRAGVSPADRDVVEAIRRSGKPSWLAVNKLDTPAQDAHAAEFFELGLERVVPISAAHGRGVARLVEEITAALGAPAEGEWSEPSEAISVAIVGRPNVGKSSLLNRLVGYERAIVAPTPGTTRDAIDTAVVVGGTPFVLIDTAGIRRRSRIAAQLEYASAVRALRALERSRVGVLVLDASEGMTDQDARLAGHAWDRGRGLVIFVNKCDLAGGPARVARQLGPRLLDAYPFLAAVPILYASAKTGEGVEALLPEVRLVAENHARVLQTAKLNDALRDAVRAVTPPSVRGRRITFQYGVQTRTCPPRITVFCSAPELVPVAYTRYLAQRLRQAFPLDGTPLEIRYRRRREQRKGSHSAGERCRAG